MSLKHNIILILLTITFMVTGCSETAGSKNDLAERL